MHTYGVAVTEVPVVLTIAAFDPSSATGVTADLKTLAAHNCYGVAAVTALTVPDSEERHSRHDIPAALLAQQVAALAERIPLAGVKIGLLGTAASIEAVVAALERYRLPFVVLDPIVLSNTAAGLLEPDALELLRDRLLPKATVITAEPEVASFLTGRSLGTLDEMKEAAEAVHGLCGAAMVITGGHLEKPQDVFFDGAQHFLFAGDRPRAPKTQGAGCTFSSAIAANLAQGKPLPDAIVLAKAYLTKTMEKGYALGHGPGLLNHLYRLQESGPPRAVAVEPSESPAAGRR